MLEGFTLFHTSKGWQLSIKHETIDGWSVRHIPESHAKRILGEIDLSLSYEPRLRNGNKLKKRVLLEE